MENIRDCPVKGAVLVTTPQMVAVDDVTRELTFCRRTGIKVLGIIENMSGFVCPNCSECSNIFATGGGQKLAEKYSVPFLGRVPIDPSLTKCLEDWRKLFGEIFSVGRYPKIMKNVAECF
ncbi:Cytosolic Fe-S cluster assembly factor NUBP2, partial [Armadillidium vulgare]